LIRDFSINKPKIAVLVESALCGGVIGTEDDLVIKPTLKDV
jgi:4-hydroxythreonine-4-phosphate dehydrogenase